MRKLAGVVVGLFVVAGSAGGQNVAVDAASRTLSVDQALSAPGSVTVGGQFTGTLDDTQLGNPSGHGLFFDFHASFGGLDVLVTPPAGSYGPGDIGPDVPGGIWATLISGYGSRTREVRWDGGYDFYSEFASDGSALIGANPGTISNYSLSLRGGLDLSRWAPGTTGILQESFQLAGVDAVDPGTGRVVGSAVFDQYGNGVFVATTPEPSSLALLGAGLLGVIPFARRRRGISARLYRQRLISTTAGI